MNNVRKGIEFVVTFNISGDESDIEDSLYNIQRRIEQEVRYSTGSDVEGVDVDLTNAETVEMQCPRCNEWERVNNFERIENYGEEGVESDEMFCQACVSDYQNLLYEEMALVYERTLRLFTESGRW